MPSNDTSASIAALAELVAELVREKDETKRLLAALSRGEIKTEQVVSELAMRYHTGVGGAVQALAEVDKAAAQQLGERLRSRLDSALAEIAGRDRVWAAKAIDDAPAQQSIRMAVLKDREDEVLLREHAIISRLCASNDAERSADLIVAAKGIDPGLSNEAVTAHLLRLFNAGLIGKERKGRYHGVAQTRSHLADLKREIEARGLRLPGGA
jgi:DNA-binding transcriptional ArsR family regulator